jgi:diguanylate cyclase (GGDEF)-like protein
MQRTDLNGLASTIAGVYAFLPFIMVAGLGMFPLTAIEGLAFALPVIGAEFAASSLGLDMLNLSHLIGTIWLSAMIATVATMSGMSQLGFMIALVRQAVRDPLTSCFSRLSGEELLEIQFIIASRSNTPLSVAFVDLDNFKSINDNYGHDAGDEVLITATNSLRASLRTGDMLVRWGGEEFILILPSSYRDEAVNVLERAREQGLGTRPDGKPMTASIGVAERTLDSRDDWRKLIEIADQRMYTAKQSGKDRIIASSPA